MLQNPSKYHPNPLSHFLALHNTTTANSHVHHHHHHHQHNNHNHGHNQHQQHHQQHTSIQPMQQPRSGNDQITNGQMDDGVVSTQLDVGKSFTIAAILGLQKSAIDNNSKEFNSVMNLSLNNHNQKQNCVSAINCGLNVNNYGCDSANPSASVVNRYLPGNSATNHLRLAHFGHHTSVSAAAAAAAVVANGPSALQSLQQLHQQQAQQANLGFQTRDKSRSDHLSNKKTSLKSKRVRTIFTPEQLERLEAEFERQQYMVGPERLYLAHTLQLTEAQVKVWFQNRRIKWRKHHLEITQQRLAIIRQRQIPTTTDENNTMNSNCVMEQITSQLNQSESDLSICNDSMDTESVNEAEDV